ncbi:LysR family transcriptional regulator [Limnohabitans sp. MMS-10A-178]|uniref:LysR family transcriptional regulator n=1 Tax=Limnohabitans sp. MMS-10A-178 TaxID=1835767 RepID=UPI001E3A3A7E|nr:LysR family transcriptional regulator [Limnohabitans sp. MMS-10A-178]
MQLFVRVAETGSFTAVADQLGMARSVVTRQISALEKQLGVKLMTRSTRSLTLTTAGSAYLEKCRAILNMVDAAESNLIEEKTEPRGRIRLGLPLSFGLQRLMPVLLEFAQAHSNIELVMDFSDRRSNLIEEGIDLSIRITSRLEPGDIVRKLGETRLLTVASPHYLAKNSRPKHPRELSQHACLVYSQNFQPTSWTYGAKDGNVNVTIRPRLAANNGEALLQAAAQGLGITRPPDFMAQPYLDNGSVVAVLQKFEPMPLGIYAVLPSNRYIPHRVSVLIDYLAAALLNGGVDRLSVAQSKLNI